MSHSQHPDFPRRVAGTFAAALELRRDDRADFLNRACGDDAEVRSEVEALLAAHESAGNFLAEMKADLAAALISDSQSTSDEDQPAGRRVGRYEIIREIGRGGMGVIYLAERSDGEFTQRVALKLIKRGMDSDAIHQRFRNERQILASLQHPGIAALFDGGVSEDGRPYFAMEFVDGTPITTYCDSHKLDIRARLQLFAEVCTAVQYAHRNLVVHRDLKPSNILITESGRVKLLDFGIARLLTSPEGELQTLTDAGHRVMTPEYAAPEQARGEPITTATDVYALGVLLCELMTGRRPYRFGRSSPDEYVKVICESSPARPSTLVGRSAIKKEGLSMEASPEEAAACRASDPATLRKKLRGDLDIIVLTALRKEPEHRYSSAESLLRDIERYLNGLPITSRAATFAYVSSKFVRRNRGTLSAAAALLVLLVSFTLLHASRISSERDIARQEAARAEQITGFLVDLFEQAGPNVEGSDTMRVEDFLDIGARRLNRELADQPDLRADMLHTIGKVYFRLGRYGDAYTLFDDALAARKHYLSPNDPAVGRTITDLGEVAFIRGEYDVADSLWSVAEAIHRRQGDRPTEDLATVLANKANLLRVRGDYEESERLHQEVLTMRRSILEPDHPAIAVSLSSLAFLARSQGDFPKAESYYRDALTIERSRFGDEDPVVASSTKNLALALHSQGRLSEAEKYYLQAIELQSRLYVDGHRELASSLNSLGGLYATRGSYAQAESRFRAAIEMHRKLETRRGHNSALTMHNLASLLVTLARFEETERLAYEALSIFRDLYGPVHPNIATEYLLLSKLYAEQEDFVLARQMLREAESAFGPGLNRGPSRLLIVFRDASISLLEKRYDRADSLYRVLLSRRDGINRNRFWIQSALSGHGMVLVEKESFVEAERLLREALQLQLDGEAESSIMTAEIRLHLGRALTRQNRYEEAESLLRTSYARIRQLMPESSRLYREGRSALAEHYRRRGMASRAAAYER